MADLFMLFTAVLVAGLAAVMAVRLTGRTRFAGLLGLAGWIAYTGTIGYRGVLADGWLGLPGPLFIVFPVMIFVALFLVRSDAAARLATAIPLSLLLGMQAYRAIVELFLHRLSVSGLAPTMLTYEGANFDIIIGLTAPLVAWAFATGRLSSRGALLWNIAGLALLANIIVRAITTAPGPLNVLPTEVPNLAIGTFPYTFIPGLMAPLALTLHVLAIRVLRARLRNGDTEADHAPLRET